jgi:hypothetical protein
MEYVNMQKKIRKEPDLQAQELVYEGSTSLIARPPEPPEPFFPPR